VLRVVVPVGVVQQTAATPDSGHTGQGLHARVLRGLRPGRRLHLQR
jgi:hypothetical protein